MKNLFCFVDWTTQWGNVKIFTDGCKYVYGNVLLKHRKYRRNILITYR